MLERKPKTRLFRGYSSIDKIKPVTELIDIELIKRDLLNHFFTVPGERVMRPNFGCLIWEYLFEPLTPEAIEEIASNVEDVINSDVRVELENLNIFEFEHGLKIDVELLYRGIDTSGTFQITFDRRNSISGEEFGEDF